jgi:hypothetical protein
MRGIICLAEEPFASEGGLSSVELAVQICVNYCHIAVRGPRASECSSTEEDGLCKS